MTKILYLVHDLDDPATGRRRSMLQAGGADVRLVGFRRGTRPLRQPATVLGRTYNGKFLQRAWSALRVLTQAKAILRGGHPDYKVAYSWDADSKLAKLTITQTQAKDGDTSSTSGLFDLRIPIGFGFVSQGKTHKVEVKPFTVRLHEREQALFFPLEKKPDFISFDVGNHTLKARFY